MILNLYVNMIAIQPFIKALADRKNGVYINGRILIY
jgi:hypothetical protein